MVADVVADRFNQVANTMEGAAANSFPRDFSEPTFDLIEPGGTGRREVHVITRTLGQPLLYFRMFMGSIIIQHEMDLQAGIN